jgi:A/G-specific adenine glycosylase
MARARESFADLLIAWQREHGRHDLPWQASRDPYRIWLSEIMLQQTQVVTVIPYFERFIARFPTIDALARADENAVLTLWSGLGYYTRARNLHRAVCEIAEKFGGVFPREFDAILSLPGIGRSTAAAIGAFAFGDRRAILDGNVKRVLARYLGVTGFPGDKHVEEKLWREAQALLPKSEIEAYTQGLMDLGATLCVRVRPRCQRCPVHDACVARRDDRVAELPTRKPAKALPEKQTVMLMILHEGEVLLEKRPPSGIWGGLWSFPEIAAKNEATRYCANALGLDVHLGKTWRVLDHGFTHYKLKIVPQPVTVVKRHARAKEGGRIWIAVQDAIGAAVPAPVRKLLGRWMEFGRR